MDVLQVFSRDFPLAVQGKPAVDSKLDSICCVIEYSFKIITSVLAASVLILSLTDEGGGKTSYGLHVLLNNK